MLKKHQSARLLVRFPNPQKEWLTRVAEHNCTSINSEVIRCVRERMEGEKAASRAKAKGRAAAAVAE